jgi:tRNA dimethylallyltransferase
LVGGTHYYTQALLFKDQIIEEGNTTYEETFPILQEPTEVILAKLRELDPMMADRWHPNDRRKIQRSLEICLKTEKPASQIYAEQRLPAQSGHSESMDDATEPPLDGSPNLIDPTLVLWPYAAPEALKSRLDSRVLDMVRTGLLEEVQALHNFLLATEAAGESVDRTRGIWPSIGYKQFEDYQKALRSSEAPPEALERLKEVGIERTQAATRQYSKRQIRWIRIKLLNALSRADALKTTFLLDGSDITQWQKTVAEPAIALTRQFLDCKALPDPLAMSESAGEMLSLKSEDLGQRPDLWDKKICQDCGVVAVTPGGWEKHLKSRGHKKATAVRVPRKFPPRAKRNEDILDSPLKGSPRVGS